MRKCLNLLDDQGKCEGEVEGDRETQLRQYGYPPDMQLLATETVLKQAEMIADLLTVFG